MNRPALVLASFVLTACAGGPVPVYWVDLRPEDRDPYQPGDTIPELGLFDRIADACAFWGLDCYETEDSERVLTIVLSTHGGPDSGDDYLCGETSHADPCAPLIFSCDHDRVLEHEIGHALGRLKHRPRDTDNVMHPNADVSGYDASDVQIDRVQNGGDRLYRCHERGWAAR